MDNPVGTLILVAVIVGIILAVREVNCWYWKINERLHIAEETQTQLGQLKEMVEDLSARLITKSSPLEDTNGSE